MVLTDCLGFLFVLPGVKAPGVCRGLVYFPRQGRGEREMEGTHEGLYVERTEEFEVAAPADVVFPLFGPDRESDWASDWRPEPVYPVEVKAVEGAVFRTSH